MRAVQRPAVLLTGVSPRCFDVVAVRVDTLVCSVAYVLRGKGCIEYKWL